MEVESTVSMSSQLAVQSYPDIGTSDPFHTEAEYEPVSEEEDQPPFRDSDSSDSEVDIIKTEVIEVSVQESVEDVGLADSEQSEERTDSEIDHHDYWQCARCHAENNNPLYSYCEKCFKVRKNFFPPRPRRKQKRVSPVSDVIPRTLSQDSGVASQSSCTDRSDGARLEPRTNKRSAADRRRRAKRPKINYNLSDSSSDENSDPGSDETIPKVTPNSQNSTDDSKDDNLCITCYSAPKSGVFVHKKVAHICCCYRCAVKVWMKCHRCPICNGKVSNVLKAVIT